MSLDVCLEIYVDTGGKELYRVELYSANITHNLTAMADTAGVYVYLWRPEEVGISDANQLIEPLRKGILAMETDPERFRAFDATNGWGTYDQFLPWIKDYLVACEEHPKAKVRAWR
ncbi:MAG: hypothetical protein KKD77_22955 [Gammaproteobacteria bacterium]|nr:hypothetical protein [Gammaproteobacteria bacterium]